MSGPHRAEPTPEAAAGLGLQALEAGTEEQAVPILKAATGRHPDNARLWQVKGLVHRSLDDLQPAIEAFEKAARLAPNDPKIVHARARVYLEAGQPRPELFDEAAALAPEDLSIIQGKAAALLMAGRGEDAMRLLQANLGRQPLWLAGHALLARMRSVMGQPERLTESLQQALMADQARPELWQQMIALLFAAGRYADALKVIDRSRQLIGPHPLLASHEAACLDEMGEHRAAALVYGSLQPISESIVAIGYVRHLLRTGAHDAAAKLAHHWTAGPDPHNFWPYVALGWRLTADPRWEWLEGDPRLIGVYDIGEKLGSMSRLVDLLRTLHVSVSQPLDQSLRGGTQTDGHLLARLEAPIRKLRAALVEAVQRHVAQLPPHDAGHSTLRHRRDGRIRFTGSWSVRLQGSGHHVHHVHPGGWFSSAFYAHLPDQSELGAPPAGWIVLGQAPAELNIDLEPFRSIEPKPGRLVLFPSTTWHGTVPFGEGERLTVAFDVAPPR